MKKLVTVLQKNYYILTPFLIAIYTVLFLYVKNQHEYPLSVIWTPLLISLTFALILLAISKLIFRKTNAVVIIASVAVFISLSYGRFLELSRGISFNIGAFHVTPEIFMGIIAGLLLLFVIILTLRFSLKLLNICKVIFIGILALVLFQIAQTVYFELESGRINRERAEAVPIKTDRSKANPANPDIYYIIPDRYAGQKAFQEQYKFDNSTFLNTLREKGFYVPENSTTNYPKTFLSLGSSLNMEYLDRFTEETEGGYSKDESLVTPIIMDNKVLRFLKDRGYSYVHMGSWWEPTKTNPSADHTFIPRRREHFGADEFTTGFYNTTIFSELLRLYFKDPTDVSETPQNNLHRQSALQQFEELRKIPNLKGPKFVFVHILLPHDPFVLDENCTPISRIQRNKNTHQVNYINQVQCVNTMLNDAIDTILKNSKTPPIIVLQSDEGPFPMNSPIDGNQSWEDATDVTLQEKFPILNAYFLPDKVATQSGFYDTITPVNSFRVLFNTYFGEEFEMLEDKNYIFPNDNAYYRFIDVTERVQE